MNLFGLVDCDSFFASCERVFRPDLYGKPVVVLSNNDGCVVAMTKEAKALGLKRGIPFYKIKSFAKQNDIAVFSSNYTLYGDISSRVMKLLAEELGDIEICSIDEAFFFYSGDDIENLKTRMLNLRQKIYRGIGVPVSIGVSTTRTLAKVASYFAKKFAGYQGVCFIDDEYKRKKSISLLPVDEVWGIGRKTSRLLKGYGIMKASDFVDKPEYWIKAKFGISGQRTLLELKGVPCKSFEDLPEKQSICTSRSFNEMVDDFDGLASHVVDFAVVCARKLRKQKSVASVVTVFILTNRYREDMPQYENSTTVEFMVPTSITTEVVSYALKALRMIYRAGYSYKKCGVIVSGISNNIGVQQNIFDKVDRVGQNKLTSVVDSLNNIYGDSTLHLAVQDIDYEHHNFRRDYRSPNYTTDIKDIITVKA